MVTKEIYVLLRDRKLVQNKAVRSMVNMNMDMVFEIYFHGKRNGSSTASKVWQSVKVLWVFPQWNNHPLPNTTIPYSW